MGAETADVRPLVAAEDRKMLLCIHVNRPHVISGPLVTDDALVRNQGTTHPSPCSEPEHHLLVLKRGSVLDVE